ncbi:hypothetical protein QBC40DRAFT_165819 [Triangularia verruculosa]|uniref:Uncharacterized protein n=1 Tax=Triangularia verruculosa TaxID=2587418 RepID=A0AAN6XNA0_9PEZI|nr:hypothetical protein QBC40DRAFT_165819 [Triangularia verruculosa]
MSSSALPRTFSPSDSSSDFSSDSSSSQSPEPAVSSTALSSGGYLAAARQRLLETCPQIQSVREPAPTASPMQSQPGTRIPLQSSRPQPSSARTTVPTLRTRAVKGRSPLRTSHPAQPQLGHFASPRPAQPQKGHFASPRPAQPQQGHFASPDLPLPNHRPSKFMEHQAQVKPQEDLTAPPFVCLPGTLAPAAAIAALTSTVPQPSLTTPDFPIPASSLVPAIFKTTLTRAQARLFSDAHDPHGYPRFLPPANLTAETDPSTFRACDCVVTLLWMYSPRLAADFFASNGAEHEANLNVFDNRVQEQWEPRQFGEGLRQVPQCRIGKMNDEITIGFRTQSSKKMCCYIARIAPDIGKWTGVEANDEVVSVGRDDLERVERFGAIIGREVLNTNFWYRQPYYRVSITVDGRPVDYR